MARKTDDSPKTSGAPRKPPIGYYRCAPSTRGGSRTGWAVYDRRTGAARVATEAEARAAEARA
jgi:hypothetical protein